MRHIERVEQYFGTKTLNIPLKMAEVFGLNEAIVLQQICKWCEYNRDRQSKHHYKSGYHWTYNSYPEWAKIFSFWSERTIRRIIRQLEESGLLISFKPGCAAGSHTKWYRPNYEQILKRLDNQDDVTAPDCHPPGHNRLIDPDKMARSEGGQNGQINYKINNQNKAADCVAPPYGYATTAAIEEEDDTHEAKATHPPKLKSLRVADSVIPHADINPLFWRLLLEGFSPETCEVSSGVQIFQDPRDGVFHPLVEATEKPFVFEIEGRLFRVDEVADEFWYCLMDGLQPELDSSSDNWAIFSPRSNTWCLLSPIA